MMRALLVVLVLGATAVGCSERPCPSEWPNAFPEPSAGVPCISTVTTWGVALRYPRWLDKHPLGPQLKIDALNWLAFAPMEADVRVANPPRGVPAGFSVRLLDPGPYDAPYAPNGLAVSEYRPSTRSTPSATPTPPMVFLTFRCPLAGAGPVVQDLPHEMRHHWTGDPAAGH